ncbi:MerR family transcriptional regulator [Ligilactobacillus salitolerans]|uniref:MerR family transcriptional regulator n=1 Tax=Ligilactobacillus salitolerans TaxID=1808352 RepID=A0A401IQ19_9LACO|nr:MerR family transcriptional regulator [Ligilactobacillus salitolerans]GBG93604.1 MerR family transcriptional regulator [Ligilactobacillus salitolerans]
MEEISKYGKRLHEIIRPDKILLSIRDAARASEVTDTQVRYWIKSGYLSTVKADNGAIKLGIGQIPLIRIIKAFMDEGYTLPAAAEKAQASREIVHSLSKLLLSRLGNIEKTEDGTIFDFGPLDEDPTQHVYGVDAGDQVKFIVQTAEK